MTHTFVIRGLDEGVYVASPAVVRYRSSPKGAVQVGHSSTPSWPLYVLGSSFSAMRNRPSLVCVSYAALCYSSPPLLTHRVQVQWGIFLLLSALSSAGPFLTWFYLSRSYQNNLKKND